jgi:acetylornithine deacetylase/succinyl-diaminopimelate desuccinylase-like protein
MTRRAFRLPCFAFRSVFCTAFLFLTCGPLAHAQATDANHKEAVDIFHQLIEINTTDSVGSVTAAAKAMQQRFLDAGFPASDMQLLGPNDRKQNLVVRYHGASGKKPILLIGHLDVVEARRGDWTTDPFQFVTKDRYYYGRGTQDMKESDAILVETLLRLHREGFKPDSDIILALTADEEGGKSNGVNWLIQNHRDLIDAEYVLNPDGGGVELHQGKATIFSVDASEKLYADYQLTATNPGGHSSLPRPDNAIYELADGLERIAHYSFPFELNGVTRDYFQTESKIISGQTARPCGHQAARRDAGVQLDPPHYMRRHAPRRRPRQQRAPAARSGHRELPHPPRPLQGRGSPGTHPRPQQPQNDHPIRW